MKTLREFESKYSFTSLGPIFLYNAVDLNDYLFETGDDIFESAKKMENFISKNNILFYSVEYKDLDVFKLIDMCAKGNFDKVVVDSYKIQEI